MTASPDRRMAYIPVYLDIGPGELTEEEAQGVLNTAAPVEAVGLEASVGAYVGQQLSKPSTEISEAVGLTAAVIILLFAFGTVTAMMLPIGLRGDRPRLRSLDPPPARGRGAGTERCGDAGDDDRSRRRHRLYALFCLASASRARTTSPSATPKPPAGRKVESEWTLRPVDRCFP